MTFQPGRIWPARSASTPSERCCPVITEKPVLTGSAAETLLRMMRKAAADRVRSGVRSSRLPIS